LDIAFNVIGRIHKTYIILETLTGMRVIDQHAAHERIIFERVMKQQKQKAIKMQDLLEPLRIETTPEETLLINNNRELLESFGFFLEEFGSNNFLVRSLPSVLGRQHDKDLLKDILLVLKDNSQKSEIDKIIAERISRIACRSAIKAGDTLEGMGMVNLVKELEKCENPYTCPHGRPTMIDLTLKELEKMFNRTRGYENKE